MVEVEDNIVRCTLCAFTLPALAYVFSRFFARLLVCQVDELRKELAVCSLQLQMTVIFAFLESELLYSPTSREPSCTNCDSQ